MRIVSWNVENTHAPAQVAAELTKLVAAHRPDVITLQETYRLRPTLKRWAKQHGYVLVQRRPRAVEIGVIARPKRGFDRRKTFDLHAFLPCRIGTMSFDPLYKRQNHPSILQGSNSLRSGNQFDTQRFVLAEQHSPQQQKPGWRTDVDGVEIIGAELAVRRLDRDLPDRGRGDRDLGRPGLNRQAQVGGQARVSGVEGDQRAGVGEIGNSIDALLA